MLTTEASDRVQQVVAQTHQETSSAQDELAARFADTAAEPLPDLAELLTFEPADAEVVIPPAAPLEPVQLDWHEGGISSDGNTSVAAVPTGDTSNPLTLPMAEPTVALPSPPAAAPAATTPPFIIQRIVDPNAPNGQETGAGADTSVDYDPIVARAEVRAMAGALNTAPAEAQQQLLAHAASTKATLQATALAEQQALEASIPQQIVAAQSTFAERRTTLQTVFQTVLEQIDTALLTRTAEATQKGQTAKEQLTAQFADQHVQIIQVVADHQRTVQQLREQRKTEAGRQMQEQANQARQRGAAVSYGGDERGRAQTSAARRVAEKTAQEIEAKRTDVERAVDDLTRSIPAELQAQGEEALRGLASGLPDLLRGIDEQVQYVVETLQQSAHDIKRQLQQQGEQLGLQLDTQEQGLLAGLQALLPQAVTQMTSQLQLMLPTVDAGAQQAAAHIARAVGQAEQTVLGIETPDVSSVQSYINQVARGAAAASDAGALFLELIDPAATQFTQLRTVTEMAAQGLNEQTATQLATLGTDVEAGLTSLVTNIEVGLTAVVDGLDTAFNDVTSEVNRTFTTSLAELTTGLGQTIQDADGKVVSTIGEGVAQTDQALGDMNGKMAEAAEEAGWRYDHPLLATLKDIGGFVTGLVVGIVAVVALAIVVIAAANLLIAGLVALGFSSLVATLIVAVVGIGALAFGIYQAYQARVASGEAGGWGTLGMALLDSTGITAIYQGLTDPNLNPFERGLTIGTGVATLGTIIFGNRLNSFVRTRILDGLSARLVIRSDITITKSIANAGSVPAEELGGFLGSRSWSGRMGEAWQNYRGQEMVYRGQGVETSEILSPLAREQGVAASEQLVAKMLDAGLTYEDIARYTARWHDQPVPSFLAAPGLGGQPLGATGIPTTRIPGIASGFAGQSPDGVVYAIRVSKGVAIKVPSEGWGLATENEFVMLNQIPGKNLVRIMSPSEIPGLTADEVGNLVPFP